MSPTSPTCTIMTFAEQTATSLKGSDQSASHIHNEGPVMYILFP